MKKTLLPIALGTLCLLALPLFSHFIFQWRWNLVQDFSGIKPLYYLTETGGMPYALASFVVLLLSFTWLYAQTLREQLQCHCEHLPRQLLLIAAACIALALGGQVVKTVLKTSFQRPRPYVAALLEYQHTSAKNFYAQTKAQKVEQIGQMAQQVSVAHQQPYPDWLVKHWQGDMEYSFPSGHTMFVACWTIFAFALFLRQQRYVFLTCITMWANLVMLSRMQLGMHYAGDLIASVLISAVLVWLTTRVLFAFLDHHE